MKVEEKNLEFRPVTVVIETQEELALLTALYGNCPSYIANMFGVDSFSINKFYSDLTTLPCNSYSIPSLDISMEKV